MRIKGAHSAQKSKRQDRARHIGKVGLYLITPPILPDNFTDILKAVLEAGDIACLQLRLKQKTNDATILQAADKLMPITQAQGVAFLINDRPDLAKQCGADGVHIGQQDMPYAQARELLGAAGIIGVTCHNSRHLAMLAAEAGADYVAFGAFYPTTTKSPPSQAEPAILQWWQECMQPPCVAIGGITTQNAAPLIAAGADFLAVCQGVWHAKEGAPEAVKQFNALFDKAN
ncbi:MAG: thiamine phosphate synthase [Alphaproteobacteria bacterium]|nr:thiamine phosphate synthase [Alphaproteobacteria bacterium]